jgi:hypothetical protein
MAHEKLFTAKQAAEAVLKKTHELLAKAEPSWKKPEKSAEQPADGKAPKGEIHPKEPVQGASDDVRQTTPPSQNPKEEAGAEGNNPGPGANPRNEGEPYKGHIKLAKFIGHMESKRLAKSKMVPNG